MDSIFTNTISPTLYAGSIDGVRTVKYRYPNKDLLGLFEAANSNAAMISAAASRYMNMVRNTLNTR